MTFRIHEFRDGDGTELMVIGVASEFRDLGQRLLQAASTQPERTSEDHPQALEWLQPSNAPRYRICLCLETADGSKPVGNGLRNGVAQLLLVAFAFVGVLAFVRWLIGLAL